MQSVHALAASESLLCGCKKNKKNETKTKTTAASSIERSGESCLIAILDVSSPFQVGTQLALFRNVATLSLRAQICFEVFLGYFFAPAKK
jgi:hypothetical protein